VSNMETAICVLSSSSDHGMIRLPEKARLAPEDQALLEKKPTCLSRLQVAKQDARSRAIVVRKEAYRVPVPCCMSDRLNSPRG